jgi:DNA-binding transcriptional ArsR family regulator
MLTMIQAIGDPTRMEILRLVRGRELAAGDIARRFAITRPAVSQHLRILREAGLLSERRVGRKRLYDLRAEALHELRDFIDGFWAPRLMRLKRAAEAIERSKKGRRDE